MVTLVNLVTICHHTKLLRYYWLYSLRCTPYFHDLFVYNWKFILLIPFTYFTPSPTPYSVVSSTLLSVPVSVFQFDFVIYVTFTFLQFSKYSSFTSLVKFISRYFLLFDAVVYMIFFLISLCGILLLVSRNATGFCILTLYPATSLNSFILIVVLLEFLVFSIYVISCHLQNINSFTSSFPIFLLNCCGWDFQIYVE